MSSYPSPSLQTPRTALVFGASGVAGYGILKALLTHPPTTFERIIGLTRRPLSSDVARPPADERLELYSEIDLLDREKSLLQLEHVRGIKQVTHVYYAAYAGHGVETKRVNCEMLTNAIGAVEICCPGLMFVTLNTGDKAYGIEFHTKVPFNPPLLESSPRIPEPYAQNIFYYEQYDILARASEGKAWNFCEIRPDAIIGFVPRNNFMNLAQGLGVFFSLYREVEGEGAEVRFPYGEAAWTALHTDSTQDLLGMFHVFASLAEPVGRVTGKTINVVDGPGTIWREVWPRLAAWFGLVGVGPGEKEQWWMKRWVGEREAVWDGLVERCGLRAWVLEGTSFGFVDAMIGLSFRRDYDSTARKEVGFMEERDSFDGYKIAFDEMRAARIIP